MLAWQLEGCHHLHLDIKEHLQWVLRTNSMLDTLLLWVIKQTRNLIHSQPEDSRLILWLKNHTKTKLLHLEANINKLKDSLDRMLDLEDSKRIKDHKQQDLGFKILTLFNFSNKLKTTSIKNSTLNLKVITQIRHS